MIASICKKYNLYVYYKFIFENKLIFSFSKSNFSQHLDLVFPKMVKKFLFSKNQFPIIYITVVQKNNNSFEMASKTTEKESLAKVIIIGDSGVGKTNLLTKFCDGVFKDSYVATIGVDFKLKTVDVDDNKFKLQIWDTAGQQRFRNITQTYYKGAVGIILAYSINNKQSFKNIGGWIKQI